MNTIQLFRSGSPYVARAIANGRKEKMLGFRERSEGYYEHRDFVGEILESNTIVPPEVANRIKIATRGNDVKEIRIYHETTKFLPAPKEPKLEKKAPEVAPNGEDILKIVLVAVGAVLLLFVRLALLLTLGLDPVVVVVYQDGSMLECATWLDYISE